MHWYILYVDGEKTFSVLSLDSAKRLIGPYLRDNRRLRIEHHDASAKLARVWRYDYASSDWFLERDLRM